MPSLGRENRILRLWQVVFTLLTAILVPEVLPENLLHGARLATFPKPAFRTNFTLKSSQGAGSFKEIRHGLNVDPFYVRVYAKPRNGSNSAFCFNGIGSSQSSPSRSSFGGLIYAYNAEFVRVWAPTDPNGHIVFVKDGWGGEVNTQVSNEAEVVVEVWKDGPAPTFQIEHVVDTRAVQLNQVYHQVDHELRQLPERVVVRLSPAETDDDANNPNKGFWFPAVSSSQNPDPNNNFGGVIFAYNERYVRLWGPEGVNNNNTGCIFLGGEYTGGGHSQKVTKCRVETLLWVNQLPTPAFQTDWFNFNGQRGDNSFKEIVHGINLLPALVIVQLRAVNGKNVDYVFEAQGATQSDDDGTNEYGGVVFAYNENKVRIWAPSKHDGSKKGYPILVKSGWGYSSNLQAGSDYVDVRVVVYSTKCNNSAEVLFEGDQCVSTLYDSYKTIVSKWSECSSICNNGTKGRLLTGCQVASRKRILSCDFENGMCGWTSTQQGGSSIKWVITNTSTPELNTGPLWGHPKGSRYIYTNTSQAAPNQRATLTSLNIRGASKCEFRFFWNMYGGDIGTFAVHVNTQNPEKIGSRGKWLDSGWNMTGDQGDIFWRAAYVNLEKFNKVYQIRFVHTLPEGNCNARSPQCTVCKYQKCPAANLAIDGIELVCQGEKKDVPVEVCRKRTALLAGCEMEAVMTSATGPAYSVVTIGLETYVRAVGLHQQLIAVYEFEVMLTASYAIWMHFFATTNRTNDISFKVDEGDWNVWRPPHKGSHALWTQFFYQPFKLRPGVHRISLRQQEYGFLLSKLALVPVQISMWTDLGMQSHHISDGFLSAFPYQSNPEPRFGRLHSQDAWCSSDHNAGYVFFQIRLPQLALLSRISIQGGKDILQKQNDYWVKNFKLKVSLDGDRYTWYRDTNGRRTFTANKDASSVMTHTLMFAALVRGLRIYPYGYENWICLRAELYGYYLSKEMCALSGPSVITSKPCIGDRNCGQNAKCTLHGTSGIKKQDDDSSSQSNNITEEFCQCFPGYHGPSCQHYGCSSNPCLNGGSCSEANGTYSCTCSPGYHGHTCQHPCKSGYYGYNCSKQCQCTRHGTCDLATGHCNCKRGYHGTYCELGCRPGYFGYNCAQKCQCKNGVSCDGGTGLCNCTLGWTGAMCNEPCSWNMWGVNCSLNCSCSKSTKYCDRFTGKCICSPGYVGEKCQQPCLIGKYGFNCSSQCQCQNKATCSKEDGTCSCTQAGWTGVLCHQPCPGGYYGIDCVENCNCQNGGACNPVTGSCTCASGYSGQFCDKPCIQGYWGRNCSIPCSCVHGAHCNPVNGDCTCRVADGCQCDSGWTGSDCNTPCNDDSWGPNCKNACLCQHSGTCNQTSGNCLCAPGFMGINCEHSCPPDRFGKNCVHKCRCASSSSLGCNSLNGTCLCKPGYTGPQCDVPCPAGRWGVNCSQSCSCVNGSCHPVFGNCTCDRGWQGLLCDQACPSCGKPCPACYHGNGSCDQSSGKCVCSPGYQGSACLESCKAGYYGEKCQRKCDCVDGTLCHHVTGQCLCKPGRTGTRCDKVCPRGMFGQNCTQTCSCVRGSCMPENDSCTCPLGYLGYSCERPCPSGAECSQKCLCRNGGFCDRVTGQCRCSPGWTGLMCQQSCSAVSSIPGRFGANCSERCICPGSCDPTSGICFCPPGYQGPNCAEACLKGWFGDNCVNKCHCMNNASCDHVNGTCTCAPGWYGANCTESCPTGYYGMQCASRCQCSENGTEVETSCDSVTGLCNCRPGYHGYKCEERCLEGYYGKNCRLRCTCKNSYACSSTDGSCTCKPGYHGKSCELSCPSDRYGVNCSNACQCVKSNTLSCEVADGTCTCLQGYTGVFCESVCPEGKYGRDCVHKCTCQNGAVCDHVSGSCTCAEGFEGRSCEKACDEGWFGVNCASTCACRNGASCNRFTGECHCVSGYYGDRCDRECASGRFGVNCNSSCDCNLQNSAKCDPKTGSCLCVPGFKGVRCDQPCEDGFYGKDCNTLCPVCSSHVIGPCEKAHGNCSCSPGYQDYLCLDDCALDRYGLSCKLTCECSASDLCHHINGMCLDLARGRFSLIVDDSIDDLSLLVRKRDIKRGLEQLMELYYDTEPTTQSDEEGSVTQARLSVLDGDNGTTAAPDNPSDDSFNPVSEDGDQGMSQAGIKHVFMVRLLELQSVVKEDMGNATRVVCVLLDNFTLVDGHYVDEVLSRVPSGDISSYLVVEYYPGKLYKPGSSMEMHLPLIIGGSVGFFLILVILALFALIRRRYKRKCGFAAYKKSNKDQAEFELQPWIGRNTGYLLAFDNPYYDVLAAMGLDDDVEEDYYNPLYDDVSVYSDSGENTSEDSCHKDLSSMVIRP